MGRLKFWIIAIVILVAGFVYVQRSKTQYTTSVEGVFSGDTKSIHTVRIQKGDDTLELVKENDEWRIAGHDTLEIRQNRIDDLLNNVLAVKRSTVMTEKAERWSTYSVDDATGTHLTLLDNNNETLGHFVFGQSKSDWSKSYVRIESSPTVYLTDSNVIYRLNTSATFWGEKPEPPQEAADSLRVEVD